MNQIKFDEHECLHELKHFLPAQSPLKDFIHHNTLHAFQDEKFHEALAKATQIFGYKTYLSLDEYRQAYHQGRISQKALQNAMQLRDAEGKNIHLNTLVHQDFDANVHPRIGRLRSVWKDIYHMNMDKYTHPTIFRLLSNYLDQGISVHHFPVLKEGFIASLRQIEKNSYISMFKSERAKLLFERSDLDISYLLSLLVGDPKLYFNYLFDQQFAHPGWSGMVAVLEDQIDSLYDKRSIQLKEIIQLELLLELDALDSKFGHEWAPLNTRLPFGFDDLFKPVIRTKLSEVLAIWQEAYEWSYYETVLAGIKNNITRKQTESNGFKAFFCIDDRECSFRRHLETLDSSIDTYGTPGFFNVEFFFQPQDGKFHTKVCPAPVQPKYLIKETSIQSGVVKDPHMSKHTHSLISGFVISQTLGFWSALKLFFNIFKPGVSPATSYSFRHMDKLGQLSIEFDPSNPNQDGLQIGFTHKEMADRVEGLLKSTGIIQLNNTLVYAVGHGASSVNNTHYAGYDCGACSGRPGSVNARVISYMANHPAVRQILQQRGLHIADDVQFIGALHDTTRDEIEFYDIDKLSEAQSKEHQKHAELFKQALDNNAKERSRRFILTNTKNNATKVHERVKLRSVSLFEPRPELNHATNTLCIIGRRQLTKDLFLDRRAFLNSYDYRLDEDGRYLLGILNAAAPVCGGINLEYYFSRTDNYKLGAGTKLPHNVMGLIGVANGTDGDLRTGLPWQMVEVHEPMRLLCVVEQIPEKLLEILSRQSNTEAWFKKEWIHLVALNPINQKFYQYRDGAFIEYGTKGETPYLKDLMRYVESQSDNIEVSLIN